MGSTNSQELDIYVEDEVAKALIETSLTATIRTRVRIKIIGSAGAIARQLAALMDRGEERATIAVFDGDQRARRNENLQLAKRMAENASQDFEAWFDAHSSYLPGDTWPEAWIIQKCKDALAATSLALSLDEDGDAAEILEYALQAGKHNEFFESATHVGLDKDHCLKLLTNIVVEKYSSDFDETRNLILSKL